LWKFRLLAFFWSAFISLSLSLEGDGCCQCYKPPLLCLSGFGRNKLDRFAATSAESNISSQTFEVLHCAVPHLGQLLSNSLKVGYGAERPSLFRADINGEDKKNVYNFSIR
jgi:hypothetical protein